jgi:hypothetical protein
LEKTMNDVDPNLPTPEDDQPTELEIRLPAFAEKDVDATVLDAPAIHPDPAATVITKRPILPESSQVEPTVVELTPLEDLSSQATVVVKRPEIPAVEVPASVAVPSVEVKLDPALQALNAELSQAATVITKRPEIPTLPESAVLPEVELPEIPVESAEFAVAEPAVEMVVESINQSQEIAKPAEVVDGLADGFKTIIEEETLPPSAEVTAEPLNAIETPAEPVKVGDVYQFIGESGSSDIPRPAMPELPAMPDAPLPPALPALPAIPPPPPPAYVPPSSAPLSSGKDRGIALILELVAGFFGFLGIGWLYAGKTKEGVLILVGFLLFNGILVCVDIVTAGFALCCHLPLNIAAIAVSAYYLHQYTKTSPDFVS